MFKFIRYIVILLAILGLYMGVFEIKVHPEKLGNISSVLRGIGSWESALAQGSYYGIAWKRGVELYFSSSKDSKFALDIEYLKADAEALAKSLDAKASPQVIIIKSKLLSETLERTKKEVDEVSKTAIAKLRDSYLKALAETQKQLDRLPAISNQFETYKNELDAITNKGDGSKSSPISSSTPAPKASTVPLKF